MTVPSKTWMRSLSPSTTRTWTRTVSPDLKVGTSLRSCSASIRSIGFMEPLLLSVAFQTVKDDGGGGTDRQVVVVARPADGLQNVVGAVQDLASEAPAGAEDEELRARVLAQPGAERIEAEPPAAV